MRSRFTGVRALNFPACMHQRPANAVKKHPAALFLLPELKVSSAQSRRGATCTWVKTALRLTLAVALGMMTPSAYSLSCGA